MSRQQASTFEFMPEDYQQPASGSDESGLHHGFVQASEGALQATGSGRKVAQSTPAAVVPTRTTADHAQKTAANAHTIARSARLTADEAKRTTDGIKEAESTRRKFLP